MKDSRVLLLFFLLVLPLVVRPLWPILAFGYYNYRHSLYVWMRGIFQDGSRFVNFQTFISLLYFRRPYTIQEYLLARVIFGEFVCKKQLADFILAEFLQF